MSKPNPIAVAWATHVMNGWSKFRDVPEEHREQVGELCKIDLRGPVMPMVNYTCDYNEQAALDNN